MKSQSAAAKLRSMFVAAIIDALDWPRNNESYERAEAVLDRLPALCPTILELVAALPPRYVKP